jgi:beta-barrel assembly-enhancing protease
MGNKYRILHPVKLVFVSALLLVQGLAQSGAPALPDPGRPGIGRDQQQQLGLEAAGEVYKQMPVLPDSSAETQYVRRLGERLVATIPPETSWPFEFHVIPQKEINAFALPGGQMFVNIGTMTAAENEAQLAGVMAHEMAHVYMQHSAKQMAKAQRAGVASILGTILGATGTTWGALGKIGLQMGAGMVMLKYSRSDEEQADAVGAIILYRVGYNPQAMVDFFKTLEAQGRSGPQFLSSHPNPGNREAAIQRQIREWPSKSYQTSSPEFANARRQAETVKVYTAEEIDKGAKSREWESLNRNSGALSGAPGGGAVSTTAPANAGIRVTLNDVMPGSRLMSHDLGIVRIVRPENWDVTPPSRQGAGYTIAPRAGVVGNGFGYGIAVNGVSNSRRNATIDQMTADIVRSLQSGGGDLHAIGDTTVINVSGIRGRSVIMQSTSPFADANGRSQKERDWLVTVPRPDGSVVYFVFVAPDSEFGYFQPTFEKILKSVKF